MRQASRLQIEGKFEEAIALIVKAQRMPGADHPDSRLAMATAYDYLQTPTSQEIAYKMLMTADVRQPASITFYGRLAGEHAKRQHFAQAEKIADLGSRYYGRQMLPVKLEIVHAQSIGHERVPDHLVKARTSYLDQCESTKDEDLVQHCRAAAFGENSEKQYQVCGGVISVISAIGGQGSRCGNDQGKAAAPGTAVSAPASVPNLFGTVVGGIFK